MTRVIASWESSIVRAVSTTIAPKTVGEIVWPCLSKSRWPTSRSIWKRLLVSAGCEMPSASDALRKLAWSARASTWRYCRNSTRSLPGYRGDNLWKNRDVNPLAMPFALAYHLSMRGPVPWVVNGPSGRLIPGIARDTAAGPLESGAVSTRGWSREGKVPRPGRGDRIPLIRADGELGVRMRVEGPRNICQL